MRFSIVLRRSRVDLAKRLILFTKGYHPSGKLVTRFKNVFENPQNVSISIFLLPQIIIMASGYNPEYFIDHVKGHIEKL